MYEPYHLITSGLEKLSVQAIMVSSHDGIEPLNRFSTSIIVRRRNIYAGIVAGIGFDAFSLVAKLSSSPPCNIAAKLRFQFLNTLYKSVTIILFSFLQEGATGLKSTLRRMTSLKKEEYKF